MLMSVCVCSPLHYTALHYIFHYVHLSSLCSVVSVDSAIRKINELVKRARMAKVHTYIIAHLRNQFGWFGKEKTQEKLLHGLLTEFKKVQQKHNLPMGDFPHVARFRETLTRFQINKFPKLPEKMMEEMEQVLSVDIPRLMKQLPGQDMKTVHEAQMQDTHANPFVIDPEKRAVGGQWTIDNSMKAEYDNAFHLLPVKAGRVSGDACKDTLMGSGLPLRELQKLWDLADCDRDGSLDSDEFAVAMYLIESYQNGIVTEMPNTLPPPLIPPTKRHLFDFE